MRRALGIGAVMVLFCALCVRGQSAARRPDDELVSRLASLLEAKSVDPAQFVISQFRDRSWVFLGEGHWRQQDVEFVGSLIPALDKAGIHVLAMEFGAVDQQADVDRLLASDEYDEGLTRRIMFDFDPSWGYVEYLDLYRRAWEVNHAKKDGEQRFRILHLNYAPDWTKAPNGIDNQETWNKVWYRGSGDAYIADVIGRELIDTRTPALIYCGSHHAFTRYRQGENDDRNQRARAFMRRTGNIVLDKGGDRVVTIQLHWTFRQRDGTWNAPAGGVIDRAAGKLNRTGGFGFRLRDIPRELLRDDGTAYAAGYEDLALQDLADGWIFLRPFSETKPVRVDPRFITDENLEKARARLSERDRAEMKTAADFVNSMREQAALASVQEAARRLAEPGAGPHRDR